MGLAEGVKAGSFTPALLFDANPAFPFSPLIWGSGQLCVDIQSVAVVFIYSFMVLPTTNNIGRMVHPFVVNTKTQSQQSTISELQGTSKNMATRFREKGTCYPYKKSVRESKMLSKT